MRAKARALFLPWLIGAVGAGIVGAAAWNLASEARTAAQQETVVTTESGVPPLDVIPDLTVIEPFDESNPNAPS